MQADTLAYWRVCVCVCSCLGTKDSATAVKKFRLTYFLCHPFRPFCCRFFSRATSIISLQQLRKTAMAVAEEDGRKGWMILLHPRHKSHTAHLTPFHPALFTKGQL